MSRRSIVALAVILTTSVAYLALLATHVTFAAFSDRILWPNNHAGAGVWQLEPDPPAECVGMTFDKIVVLTNDNDTWDAADHDLANKALLVFGLGGNDTIKGSNHDDCIVGGDGVDSLYGRQGEDVLIGDNGNDYLDGGNAKDHMYGGAGDDTLIGDNAQDYLDGGDDDDSCTGGHAPDTVTNCEVTP